MLDYDPYSNTILDDPYPVWAAIATCSFTSR